MSQATRQARLRKHKRIRKYLKGDNIKPRLCVYRSLNNLNAQIIDDVKGSTVLSVSTLDKEFKKSSPSGSNIKSAALLGEFLAKASQKKGISSVVFDRGGYLYHGRIKAFADGARKGGLKF